MPWWTRVRPRLVARPAVRGDRSPELDVGHRRDVRTRIASRTVRSSPSANARPSPTPNVSASACMSARSTAVGRVPEMREHLALGREAPHRRGRRSCPGREASRVGYAKTLPNGCACNAIAVLVHHRRMEIDPTVRRARRARGGREGSRPPARSRGRRGPPRRLRLDRARRRDRGRRAPVVRDRAGRRCPILRPPTRPRPPSRAPRATATADSAGITSQQWQGWGGADRLLHLS